MKWLILLSLLLLVVMFVGLRYRRQIKTALYVWRMFRQMRQVGKPAEKRIEKQENSKDAALVRCAKCGVWTPQNKALNLRSGTHYCSTVCLENAVKVN